MCPRRKWARFPLLNDLPSLADGRAQRLHKGRSSCLPKAPLPEPLAPTCTSQGTTPPALVRPLFHSQRPSRGAAAVTAPARDSVRACRASSAAAGARFSSSWHTCGLLPQPLPLRIQCVLCSTAPPLQLRRNHLAPLASPSATVQMCMHPFLWALMRDSVVCPYPLYCNHPPLAGPC